MTATKHVLIDTLASGPRGAIAERALKSCAIIVNRNNPGDQERARLRRRRSAPPRYAPLSCAAETRNQHE
jgi:hypothetical protein